MYKCFRNFLILNTAENVVMKHATIHPVYRSFAKKVFMFRKLNNQSDKILDHNRYKERTK